MNNLRLRSRPILANIGRKTFMCSEAALPKYETLKITVPSPYVYNVQLNRPEKRNAMSHTMWIEVKNCFEALNDDENCRSIILSGAGSLFCAGIDLQCFMDMSNQFKDSDDVARRCKVMFNMIKLYQSSLSSLEKCVKPVISATHSACIGAGINMICSADIRYCTSDGWFQIKEVDLGMAADVGVIQRFPKIIGNDSVASELIYTGRKMEALEAKEIGFVSRIFQTKEEMMEEALKIAVEISSKSPVAVQTAKKSKIYSRDHPVDEGLDHLALINQTMLQSEDMMAAIMSAFSKGKDPPVFSKL